MAALPPAGPLGMSGSTPHAADATSSSSGLGRPCPLPPERQLSVLELRRLEVQRYEANPFGCLPHSSAPAAHGAPRSTSDAPFSGDPRSAWLHDRLIRLIHEDMVCPVVHGAGALELLELFERVTEESFFPVSDGLLKRRTASIGKVMGTIYLAAAAGSITFDPPLQKGAFTGCIRYNRCPKVRRDVAAWAAAAKLSEAYSARQLRPRELMAQEDAGLAAWIRGHRYLQPVDVENGESGLALLLLWEVDHGRTYPRQGGAEPAAVLMGFSRRLARRVQEDKELSQWLVSRYMQRPLAPGLPTSHHTRWSLRVVQPPPSEPQGWYEDFVQRWRHLLEAQMVTPALEADPHSVDPTGSTGVAPRQRGHRAGTSSDPTSAPKRRRTHTLPPPASALGQQPSSAAPASTEPTPPPLPAMTPAPPAGAARSAATRRPRPPEGPQQDSAPTPRKRQATMLRWLQPAAPDPPPPPLKPHGRASQGPPT